MKKHTITALDQITISADCDSRQLFIFNGQKYLPSGGNEFGMYAFPCSDSGYVNYNDENLEEEFFLGLDSFTDYELVRESGGIVKPYQATAYRIITK